jgi:hypothetical protein
MVMSNATPMIPNLIDEPDVLEIVRDQVAAILSLELQNQFKLAQEKLGTNIKEFDIPVYVENGRPYESSGDKPIMRFVNVLLPKVTVPQVNARVGNQKETATFFIDCAACGNDDGNFRDDKSASIRAWKVCRIIRRILMSDVYMYLGMRGTIGQRIIVSMEAGTPDYPKDNESALAYVVIRVALEVTFLERSIESPSVIMEPIQFEIDPVSGELVAD